MSRPRSAVGMVELPRYVKPYRKPNGRMFYYYEKFRNTPRAWPRFRMPFAPDEPGFWKLCEHLECNYPPPHKFRKANCVSKLACVSNFPLVIVWNL